MVYPKSVNPQYDGIRDSEIGCSRGMTDLGNPKLYQGFLRIVPKSILPHKNRVFPIDVRYSDYVGEVTSTPPDNCW